VRFVSFSTTQLPKPHLGILQEQDNEVLDVDLVGQALKLDLPDQLLDLIENYERYQPALQTIQEKAGGRRFSEVKTFRDVGAVQSLDAVQLAAPIPRPRKNVLCVATNYLEHIKETAGNRDHQGQAPANPVFFTKSPTTVVGPDGEVIVDPAVSSQMDWEAELGVILGKSGKNIREEDALSYIFGYTVLNDVTARDLQVKHKQFFKGKSLDTSCPMGPSIVTADEVANPQHLNIKLRVNGETKQDSNTELMIFSIANLISVLSQGMTLEAGDIIATGTPSGVGFTRKPPEFLQAGDIVEAEVEGIGVLRNRVVGPER
jgi:2-keto-4-pentenoate hydratase/2-oxohepta-3-ene-1,7-dioic acid hydratase in catechol pathway